VSDHLLRVTAVPAGTAELY